MAELADAQVSEACDGDIVEVQVLSSAPKDLGEPQGSPFLFRVSEEGLDPYKALADVRASDTRIGLNFIKSMKSLNVTSTIEHKHEGLPRFVCIPIVKVDPWELQGTTTVEVSMNGVNIGRRSLKRWEDRDCWWMDLSNDVCRRAAVGTGDTVSLSLTIASAKLPDELGQLIKSNSKARARWEALTPGQQRMLREEVLAAKQSETRGRRAARALGPKD